MCSNTSSLIKGTAPKFSTRVAKPASSGGIDLLLQENKKLKIIIAQRDAEIKRLKQLVASLPEAPSSDMYPLATLTNTQPKGSKCASVLSDLKSVSPSSTKVQSLVLPHTKKVTTHNRLKKRVSPTAAHPLLHVIDDNRETTSVHEDLPLVTRNQTVFLKPQSSKTHSPVRFFPISSASQKDGHIFIYMLKKNNSNNHDQGGIDDSFNHLSKFPIVQCPTPYGQVISFKLGSLRIHCTYLTSSVHNKALNSSQFLPNTIICGNFSDRQLNILNATFTGREINSIIDLFIANIPTHTLLDPSLIFDSNFLLGSDHRLLTLDFDFVSPTANVHSSVPDQPLAPRKLWNLSKLHKPVIVQKHETTFGVPTRPPQDQLKDSVEFSPDTCPTIDALNGQPKEGNSKVPAPPRKIHDYWTQELQDAVNKRDSLYRRWRYSIGIDKVHYWYLHSVAQKDFRKKLQHRKREYWKLSHHL